MNINEQSDFEKGFIEGYTLAVNQLEDTYRNETRVGKPISSSKLTAKLHAMMRGLFVGVMTNKKVDSYLSKITLDKTQ